MAQFLGHRGHQKQRVTVRSRHPCPISRKWIQQTGEAYVVWSSCGGHPALSGLVSMAAVKDGYLPHKGTASGQLHLCHAGPTAIFLGQGKGPRLPGLGARVCQCANICSWTKQYWEALWACFQMESRAIKRGTEPAPLLSKGPLRKTPGFYRQLNTGYLVGPLPSLHSVHIPLSCDKPISSLYISVRHV